MTRYLEIKSGSISEVAKKLREDYDAYFKKELEKEGKGIAQMTDAEKKAFFNRIDKEYNAKNEANEPVKPDDSKTTLVAAPGNKEKVIRIPKEKLADYKAKGYVEAESFVPEEKKVKEEELTAGQKKLPPALQKAIEKKEKNEELTAAQKKLPPALQKAIEKKEKNEDTIKAHDQQPLTTKEYNKIKNAKKVSNSVPKEEVEIKEEDAYDFDRYLVKKDGSISKDNNDVAVPDNKQHVFASDLKDARAKAKKKGLIKEEEVELDEAGMKAIATDQAELKRLRVRLQQLRDTENASAGGDTTDIERQIHQTRLSILDLQKKELEKEDVDADVINNKQKEVKGEKEIVKEGRKNYKSYKKSLKKEEEDPKKTKSTLTGKPLTKINVEPKLDGHN